MAVHINTLNGGNITITTGGSTLSEHPETRFTLQDETVETYNITGTLDQQWMIDNGYYHRTRVWLKPITQADIGNTVTSIGEYAFLRCGHLTNVTIGSEIQGIGIGAFATYVDNPITLTIGKTVAEVQTMGYSNWSLPSGSTIVCTNGTIPIE